VAEQRAFDPFTATTSASSFATFASYATWKRKTLAESFRDPEDLTLIVIVHAAVEPLARARQAHQEAPPAPEPAHAPTQAHEAPARPEAPPTPTPTEAEQQPTPAADSEPPPEPSTLEHLAAIEAELHRFVSQLPPDLRATIATAVQALNAADIIERVPRSHRLAPPPARYGGWYTTA
jgi:hypothetical protein